MKKQLSTLLLLLIPAMSLIAGGHVNRLISYAVPVENFPLVQVIQQTKDSIYITPMNIQIFKELIVNSGKDYHLVIFFTEWCQPCTEKLPQIKNITEEFHNLTCYYVYSDTEKNIKFLRKYLHDHALFSKIYILDNSYTGNVKKRFKRFRNQICNECESNIGFPTLILLDRNMNVLYKSTGSIEELKEILTKNVNK